MVRLSEHGAGDTLLEDDLIVVSAAAGLGQIKFLWAVVGEHSAA